MPELQSAPSLVPQWIWIDPVRWPNHQRCQLTLESEPPAGQRFGVAEFMRVYQFDRPLASIDIEVSGDTRFWLYADEQFIGTGPVCVGGDFGPALKPTRYFINRYSYETNRSSLCFRALVQLSPAVLMDLSCGHGGFWLSAAAHFSDGSSMYLATDAQWQGRLLPSYLSSVSANFTAPNEPWLPAVPAEDIWPATPAPIPMLDERLVAPVDGFLSLDIPPHAEKTIEVEFDKIHAAYVSMQVQAQGRLTVALEISEIQKPPLHHETFITNNPMQYRGLRLYGIGHYRLRAINESASPAKIFDIGLISSCYPVSAEGRFDCSDRDLNKVYRVSKWTLRICRQSIHLDGPVHQELLACTGDYFIQSLMNYFTFGDPRLTRLDLIRTADRLVMTDGKMFHTSYSLIWVRMLYDYYLFTGDRDALGEVSAALHILLKRFSGYVGENGVIDQPPDYMFVDWTVIDGYSLHHPPKAIGQTSLNAFYYQALITAASICGLLGDQAHADTYRTRAHSLKSAFNRLFWDEDRGLYHDGLNDETPVHRWLPQNSSKRYFTKYGNTLAALYGLCGKAQGARLMERVLHDPDLPDVQPYFMHFILEAVHQAGLFEQYGLPLLRRWKIMVDECDKGLKEGWFPPQEDYYFDYSHAWTGTPAYQLPARLMGFEMLEPGFRRISLRPRLCGLRYADIEMPTPFGMLRCRLREGKAPWLDIPEEIAWHLRP